MRVKATKVGFYGGGRRRVGEVFDMEGVREKQGQVLGRNGRPVSWVVPADGERTNAPKALGPSGTEPKSTSESSGADSGDSQ